MKMNVRYKVWPDSESDLCPKGGCYFENIDDAMLFASRWVHEYDQCSCKAILHIEDCLIEETVETVENSPWKLNE